MAYIYQYIKLRKLFNAACISKLVDKAICSTFACACTIKKLEANCA